MATIRTRAAKTSALTQNELDNNFKRTVTQKTDSYQILISDNRSVIEANKATATTMTLPPVATADNAETGDYEVTVTNIGAGISTVTGSGAELIDGAANLALNQWDSATFQLDSAQTGWKISSTSTLAPVIGNTATNAIMELVWPVGSVYQSTVSTDPNTLFGVGSWTAIEDVMLIGKSATYTTGGGSADAIVVAHTHTGPSHTHTGPSHTHTGPSHTHNIAHTHTQPASTSSGNDAIMQTGATGTNYNLSTSAASTATSGAAGTGNTGASGTGATGASGTGATGSTGSSATGANLPPYEPVYMWKRVS